MNIKQVRSYYENKENYPCPLTEKLIKAGYQQAKGHGYMDFAKEQGLEIDYRKGEPNQWWHLIRAYCDFENESNLQPIQIKCGELLVWMAEIANCCDNSKLRELEELVDKIIASGESEYHSNETTPNVKYQRGVCNTNIRKLCMDDIIKAVEESYRTSNL
ncbi:MAG: hypothetical protein WBA84_11085 [Carnobacterium sp.]|uniref:hypothetical protein n=1 Tax=Carnobacterium sp. TaxID=48221 RepID=UPI003C75AE2D